MNRNFHSRWGISAASLNGRGVSRSSQARLWPGPGRLSLSAHPQILERRLPGSGRFGIVVARTQDLRAAQAAASELLRFGLSLLGRDRKDGRVLHALIPRDVRLPLPSRVNFLQQRAVVQPYAMVGWHLAIQMNPEDPQLAMNASSPRHPHGICARGCVFSQASRRCGRKQNRKPIPVLPPVRGEMRRPQAPGYSTRRTIRSRPVPDATIVGSHIQRMREAR